MALSKGEKTTITVIVVIVIILIIIAIIGGIYYYKKVYKPSKTATVTVNAARQVAGVQTYIGVSGNRTITLYWHTPIAGLYTIETPNNLQYGCFAATPVLSGGNRIMFYAPDYTGAPIPLPDPGVCANVFSSPIATIVLTAPNAGNVVTGTVTSIVTSPTNNLGIVKGESFQLSKA